MSELLTVPCILIGNRQLPPDAMSMSAVEFSPQSASVVDIEQSEAVRASDMDIRLGTPTISAKAATFDNRIVDFLVFVQTHTDQSFLRRPRLELHLSVGTADAKPCHHADSSARIGEQQFRIRHPSAAA